MRSDLRNELLDLPLRPMHGSRQQRIAILGGQVRSEQSNSRQVKTAVGQEAQEHRMLARGSSHRDAQVGLGLGQVQDVRAVREHRRRGFASKEPASVHFRDVLDDLGLDAARLSKQLRQAMQKLVVGHGCESLWLHAPMLVVRSDTMGPIAAYKRRHSRLYDANGRYRRASLGLRAVGLERPESGPTRFHDSPWTERVRRGSGAELCPDRVRDRQQGCEGAIVARASRTRRNRDVHDSKSSASPRSRRGNDHRHQAREDRGQSGAASRCCAAPRRCR